MKKKIDEERIKIIKKSQELSDALSGKRRPISPYNKDSDAIPQIA